MFPFCLSVMAWVRYWIPPAQCGFRAHAGPPTSSATSTMVPGGMDARRFTESSSSSQAVAVDGETERRPQEHGRLARRQHARHEDLEVLHHLRDAGVDRE